MQSSQFDQSLGPSPSGSHLSLRTDEVRSSPRQSATSHANNAPNSNVAGHEQLETAQRRPQVTIVEPTHDGASWTEPDPQHIEDTDNSVKMTATKSMHGNVKSKPEASKLLRWLRRKQVASSSSAMAQDGISFEQSIPERPSHQPARSRRNSGASNSVTSENTREALQLVRAFTKSNLVAGHHDGSSGAQTPNIDRYIPDLDYVPTPRQYKPSVFGALLTSKLSSLEQERANQRDFYKHHDAQSSKASLSAKPTRHHRRSRSHDPAANNSGTSTPSKKIKWYDKPEHSAVASMLVHSAMSTASPGLPETTNAIPPPKSPRTPPQERFSSTVDLEKAMVSRRSRPENFNSEQALIAELKDIVACRKYLIKLCGAFMKFGAPTHRMEEYLTASARALAIDAEFLYIPGAMICTFIDNSMQANNVEVVRKNSGVDLGRLKDVFDVYKCVIHHKYTAEVGAEEIDKIQKRPDLHHVWFRVLMFGLASVVVGPFSFNTRPIDFGPIFILGCWLGHMQLRVVPKSDQFSNVFEVFACVVIAFVSRGLGSIPDKNGNYIFCFSAVAQSSIAMILPGFLVLNSALELQSRNIVAGSVRMVYAIIYVLFLGFGLLLGTVAFGLINRKAVNDVSCSVPSWFLPGLSYKLLYTRFVWVPLFACCVALIYKAKWSQLPVMALIAVAGHQANFWISTQLSSNLQVANAIGAFVIGCMANLYSRLFHGLAAASMLPAIYCQVPGGLAASGSLVAGVNSSSQIFGNSNTVSVINNGTAGFVAAQDNPNSVYGGTIFNVGYGMVQVAIGISVGLYLSALVIYPFGKRRSGLFSF